MRTLIFLFLLAFSVAAAAQDVQGGGQAPSAQTSALPAAQAGGGQVSGAAGNQVPVTGQLGGTGFGGQAVILPGGFVTTGGPGIGGGIVPLVQTPSITLGGPLTPNVATTPTTVVVTATGAGVPIVQTIPAGAASDATTTEAETVLLDSSGRPIFNLGAGQVSSIYFPGGAAETRSLGEIARQYRNGQGRQAARTFTNQDIERLNQEPARDLDMGQVQAPGRTGTAGQMAVSPGEPIRRQEQPMPQSDQPQPEQQSKPPQPTPPQR